MTRTIDNSQDVMDSRDIIERLEELQGERDALQEKMDELAEGDCPLNDAPTFVVADWYADNGQEDKAEELREACAELTEWNEENGDELKAIKELNEEGENSAEDWIHGATLIRESYFVEYCQDLVSDIGDMPKEIPSYIVIDWEATAKNLEADYSTITFDGVDYLVR